MRTALLVLASLAVAACGGQSPLGAARDSLHVSERVVTDLDAKVAHGPASFGRDTATHVADPAHDAGWSALTHALGDARSRLDDAEQSLDAWERDDAGDLAWRTLAPCLEAALARVATALRTIGARDDPELEEAIVSMQAESVDACAQPEDGP